LSFDSLSVFVLQVQSHSKIIIGFLFLTELFINLAQEYLNGRLSWQLFLKDLEFQKSSIVPFEFNEGISFLESIHAVFGVDFFAFFKTLEGFFKMILGSGSHAFECIQNWVVAIEFDGVSEQTKCGVKFFLFKKNIPLPPVCAIGFWIKFYGFFKFCVCFFVFLIVDVFVSHQTVSIAIIFVQFDASLEEFQGLFVILLKTEAISDYNPGFRLILR